LEVLEKTKQMHLLREDNFKILKQRDTAQQQVQSLQS
jgi:chromosome segregation protein